MKTIFFLILVLIFLTACGQTKNRNTNSAYKIDTKLKDKIEQKVKSYNGVTKGSMEKIKIYENDSLIGDSYTNGKSFESRTMSTLEGDTANITGFLGMFAGLGFQITLYRDTCIIRHFAKSDAEIYKLNKSDSLTFGVSVPCKSYKLILVNKPTFKKGDVIEGIIELSSENYYEVANGKENKSRVELIGYFKTEPLQSLDDKLKKYDEQK